MFFTVGNSATARLSVFPPDTKVDVEARDVLAPEVLNDQVQDDTLIGRIATGDNDALSLLFFRYANVARNIGRAILRHHAETDDLVQEVFLYIHRKSALFDSSKGCARSWIIQVAYTQALLRRRQLKSHGYYSSGIMDNHVENLCDSVESTNYIDTIEGLFGTRGWKTAWSSLTDFQQETFRLHFYEGCNFNEIAEKLGQSYVNIRHHYYRGLEKLRKHAEDNGLRWP